MGAWRIASASALACLAMVRSGHAESTSPSPDSAAAAAPTPAVPIELRGSLPALRLEVQDPRSRRPLAYCDGSCSAMIVPGRYRFFANGTADTLGGGRDVDIQEASRILITPGSEARRSTGLVLGIVGPALMVVGAVLFVSNPGGGSSSELGTGDAAVAGVGMMLTGVVLTPIGWVMFGTSSRPKVLVTPLDR